MTRGEILEALKAKKYTGPTSYGKERLQEILTAIENGKLDSLSFPRRGRPAPAEGSVAQ